MATHGEKTITIDRLECQADTVAESITELRAYLQSDKFWSDPTVQVQDVLTRLAEIQSAVLDVEYGIFGMNCKLDRDGKHLATNGCIRLHNTGLV